MPWCPLVPVAAPSLRCPGARLVPASAGCRFEPSLPWCPSGARWCPLLLRLSVALEPAWRALVHVAAPSLRCRSEINRPGARLLVWYLGLLLYFRSFSRSDRSSP